MTSDSGNPLPTVESPGEIGDRITLRVDDADVHRDEQDPGAERRGLRLLRLGGDRGDGQRQGCYPHVETPRSAYPDSRSVTMGSTRVARWAGT